MIIIHRITFIFETGSKIYDTIKHKCLEAQGAYLIYLTIYLFVHILNIMSIINLKEAVEKAVAEENWYAALTLALTLPDICSKLENPLETNSKKRYITWFDKYLLSKYTYRLFDGPTVFLTGDDLYALRCSLLHEGNEDISSQKARLILNKFIFATAGSHCNLFDNSILTLNVARFCQEICESVDEWLINIKSNPDINARISEMLTIRGNSYSPIPGVVMG